MTWTTGRIGVKEMHEQGTRDFVFVVACNNDDVLGRNVLASPDIHEGNLIIKRGSVSAASAYAEAWAESTADYMIFLHQDVFLPRGWLGRLGLILDILEAGDQRLGVLGCYGVMHDGRKAGHLYCHGQGRVLGEEGPPVRVRTLDECLLVLPRRSGLQFDPAFPHFHFYGTDICLQAEALGLSNWVFSDLCVHNTRYIRCLPQEFWGCAEAVRKKWRTRLPVTTTCTTVYPGALHMRCNYWIYRLRALRNPHKFDQRLTNPALPLSSI